MDGLKLGVSKTRWLCYLIIRKKHLIVKFNSFKKVDIHHFCYLV